MTDTRSEDVLEGALGGMRATRAPLREAQQWTDRRSRALPGLEAIVAREARTLSRRRWAARGTFGIATAAIAAGALFGWLRPQAKLGEPSAQSTITAAGAGLLVRTPSSHATRHVASGEVTRLSRGDYVMTGGDSRGSLRTTRGVQADLDVATEVSLEGADQETIFLHRGSAMFQVPRQAPGQTFVVQTTLANIVVHGTKFRLSIEGPDYSPCVEVFEGLVSVEGKSQTFLRPGETLGCNDPAPEATAVLARPGAGSPKNSSAKLPDGAGQRRAYGPSSLAAENALFQEALRRQRHSEFTRAEETFRELLHKYPESPLAERARVELERLHTRSEQEPSR